LDDTKVLLDSVDLHGSMLVYAKEVVIIFNLCVGCKYLGYLEHLPFSWAEMGVLSWTVLT